MRPETDPYGDNLDLRTLANGLARSWRWIVALTVAGVLVGLATGLTRPNSYVSSGKIEVRLGIRERVTPESSLQPLSDVPAPLPGIGDELELLYNPEVYRRIAQRVGPERLLAPYDPGADDTPGTPVHLRAIHALQSWWFGLRTPGLQGEEALAQATRLATESIEVVALGGTSYLLVRSTASSPEVARLMTQSYLLTAREWHREVYSSLGDLSLAREQLERYEGEAERAESEFSAHVAECGFLDLETQKRLLVNAVEEHEARIREGEIRLFEIEEGVAFVERELEHTPTTIETLVRPGKRVNPEYQSALDQLEDLTTRRAALGLTYTEGSELYRTKLEELDRQIERAEARLADLPSFIDYGSPYVEESPNPRHEELDTRGDELRQERETRARSLEMWRTRKAEQEERLRAALSCEPVHRNLSLALERTKSRVAEHATALERAEVIDLLDRQEGMDSLRIAQQADLPLEKEGPDRLRFLLLGLAGGLAAGLFLAALRFLVDDRLHDVDALEREGLAVLAVVPERGHARMRARAAARRKA